METKMDPVLADIKKINKQNNSFLVYHYLIKALTYTIEKYAAGKVLDVGCGNKPYRSLFKDNITEYTGCDINQTSLNSVDIICNVLEIPLPDESFDTVLCTQVIEHVYDNKKLLKEICRLFKKEAGLLFFPVHFTGRYMANHMIFSGLQNTGSGTCSKKVAFQSLKYRKTAEPGQRQVNR